MGEIRKQPSEYNLPAGPAIVEMEGNFNGKLDRTSRHIFVLSHEIHCCLCKWTEFSSGRFCGLLEWLLEFNDLKCLPLSSAKNGITGLPPTNWLYNASLLRASGLMILSPRKASNHISVVKMAAAVVSSSSSKQP